MKESLKFPEILEELKVPESEFIDHSTKKKIWTEEEIFVESMVTLQTEMPRIHKLMTLMWGHPKDFDPWIETLWLDDRGDRQGFSPKVMLALHKLHDLHVKKFGTITKNHDAWVVNRKIL